MQHQCLGNFHLSFGFFGIKSKTHNFVTEEARARILLVHGVHRKLQANFTQVLQSTDCVMVSCDLTTFSTPQCGVKFNTRRSNISNHQTKNIETETTLRQATLPNTSEFLIFSGRRLSLSIMQCSFPEAILKHNQRPLIFVMISLASGPSANCPLPKPNSSMGPFTSTDKSFFLPSGQIQRSPSSLSYTSLKVPQLKQNLNRSTTKHHIKLFEDHLAQTK